MVLVTLRGCHLLDSLVVVSVEARKEIVRCFEEELCEGHCARPTGAAKSNSSKARREGRQVVRSGQVLELVVSTPRGRV
jgi:DNA-binding IscR family transcriptional regulator